jgi:hypothetical protein
MCYFFGMTDNEEFENHDELVASAIEKFFAEDQELLNRLAN